MAISVLEWETLSEAEQLMLAAAAETSPLHFTALWYNVSQADKFRSNWHHHYFNWAVQQVLDGHAQNLLVNTPPGSTKTEFFSIHLPAYCFAKFERVRILNTCYSGQLVEENSGRTRALLKSAEFRQFYPFQMGKDQVNSWTLEQDGKRKHQLNSRSSNGQVTGVRGGYMGDGFTGYIGTDDWDKPDDMFSPVKRERSQLRLVNTLRSRKAHSGTPYIAAQQRLHVDDSSAFLLNGGMGLTIDLHIKIPALIDMEYIKALPDGIRQRCIRDVCGSKQVDGKWSYWPAKETVEDLLALRQAHPYTFASQYQQEPEKLDGGIFFESDFRYYGDVADGADLPEPPYFDYRFITADTAQKTNTWNDYTVFAEWGVYEGRLYRLAYKRARMDAKVLRRDFESFVKASFAKNGGQLGNLRKVLVEDKSSGTGLIQEVQGRLPIAVTPVPRGPERDKLTRALDVQSFHAAGLVVLPYGAPENYEQVAEVASFTADDSHLHDDQTDVMVDALEEVCLKPVTGRRGKVRVGRR